MDPANADVTSVCAPSSDCEARTEDVVENMLAQDARVEGKPPTDVISIDEVRDLATGEGDTIASGNAYEVTFTTEDIGNDYGRIVNSEGEVLFHFAPEQEGRLQITRLLLRAPDEQLSWRFAD